MTEGLVLPGWFCPSCRIFNGEAKEKHLVCRICETPRPAPAPDATEAALVAPPIVIRQTK